MEERKGQERKGRGEERTGERMDDGMGPRPVDDPEASPTRNRAPAPLQCCRQGRGGAVWAQQKKNGLRERQLEGLPALKGPRGTIATHLLSPPARLDYK